MGTNLTVYHINPYHLGVLPINMDTGDAWGDIFFDLRSKVLPLECDGTSSNGMDCSNPEVTADDLVLTKLVLEVDNRFGDYGRCNVCVNGSDHHGTNNCTDGEYVCTCGGGHHGGGPKPCGKAVGYENVTAKHTNRTATSPGGCSSRSKEWQCWTSNVVHKLSGDGGAWYSTPTEGYCGDGSAPAPEGCTWRVVEVAKIVNKTCSDDVIYNTLETYDDQQCFTSCGDSGVGKERNTSSYCWMKCFYTTLLGADAGTPQGGRGGIPGDMVLAAWDKAFVGEEEGGCTALEMPPQLAPPPPLVV